eukprot:Em0021g237a
MRNVYTFFSRPGTLMMACLQPTRQQFVPTSNEVIYFAELKHPGSTNSYCKLVHLARTTPPSLSYYSLQFFDEEHALSKKLDDHLFQSVLTTSSPANKARLLSASAPHASSWISVVPSVGLGLHLDPAEFQAAVKWWLGMNSSFFLMEECKNVSSQWAVWIFCDHYNENDVLKRIEKYTGENSIALWYYIVARDVSPEGEDCFVIFIRFDRPIKRSKLCRLMVNDSLGSRRRLYSGQTEATLVMKAVQDAQEMESFVRSRTHCVLIVCNYPAAKRPAEDDARIVDNTIHDWIKEINLIAVYGLTSPAMQMKLIKIAPKEYDAGKYFSMVVDGNRWKIVVSNEEGLKMDNARGIFLIDHAWTYQPHVARNQLKRIPGLASRMAMLMDLDGIPEAPEVQEQSNMEAEVGELQPPSSETVPEAREGAHGTGDGMGEGEYADEPSDELVDKVFAKMWEFNNAYTVSNSSIPVWYVMDEFGSRIQHSDNPSVAMSVFFYIHLQVAFSVIWPLRDLDCEDEVTRTYYSAVDNDLAAVCHMLPWSRGQPLSLTDPLWSQLDQFVVPAMTERCKEDLPCPDAVAQVPSGPNLVVYTDLTLVKTFLTHPAFSLTSTEEKADILWLCEHFKKFRNQDNVWIVKPWNLGRGMDIQITDNLTQIIRLAQTGPKIASKYITSPVLFDRPDIGGKVKFDVRYVVLVPSVAPLVLYSYNVFWLRPFSMDNFTDYQKHFTVMNYLEGVELNRHIHFNEFIPEFERQYPDHSWKSIENKIHQMLRELFQSACSLPPPAGIAPSPQSRAIYAADIMLEWTPQGDIQPVVLEMNYSPDCVRACKYHPDFFNHIFELFFLDPTRGVTFQSPDCCDDVTVC